MFPLRTNRPFAQLQKLAENDHRKHSNYFANIHCLDVVNHPEKDFQYGHPTIPIISVPGLTRQACVNRRVVRMFPVRFPPGWGLAYSFPKPLKFQVFIIQQIFG